MATDPNDIRLSRAQKELIAKQADEAGKTSEEIAALFTQAIVQILDERTAWLKLQEDSLAKLWVNDADSVFDEL